MGVFGVGRGKPPRMTAQSADVMDILAVVCASALYENAVTEDLYIYVGEDCGLVFRGYSGVIYTYMPRIRRCVARYGQEKTWGKRGTVDR